MSVCESTHVSVNPHWPQTYRARKTGFSEKCPIQTVLKLYLLRAFIRSFELHLGQTPEFIMDYSE